MHTEHSPPHHPGLLTTQDVADIFSAAAGRPIKATTVVSYVKESRPMVGSKRGRYANNPLRPAPKRFGAKRFGPSAVMVWPDTEETRAELLAWWHSRPTQGHGTGGRGKGGDR